MVVASAFEQRRVAAQLRDEGKDWADIAATLRKLYGLSGLAAARQAHSWSQQKAADEWCRRWPEQRIEQKTLSAWECWPWKRSGRIPTLHTIARLAELYEVAASDLLAGWADFRRVAAARESTYRYPARMAPKLTRREAMKVAAGAGASVAFMGLPLPEGVRVGTADIAHLEGVALDLWETTHHRGAGAYQDVLDQLAHVKAIIDQAFYGETVGLGFQRVAGHLQYLAGWLAFNEVQSETAWRHLNEAFRFSRTADDDRLAVLTLAEMSLEASLTGSGRDAVELAQAAGRLARGFVTPGILSRLAAREALGRAKMGETAAAQALLVRAEQVLDEADRDLEDGSWLDRNHWDAGGVQNAIGETHLALGLPVAAEKACRTAVAACRPDWPRSRALFSSHLASALVTADKIDEGASVVVETLDLVDGVHAPKVIAALRALRPAFEAHGRVAGVPEALHAITSA